MQKLKVRTTIPNQNEKEKKKTFRRDPRRGFGETHVVGLATLMTQPWLTFSNHFPANATSKLNSNASKSISNTLKLISNTSKLIF
jgi:hypothetical protein